MESLAELAQAELHHMESVAQMYLSSNGATPDFDRVILRDTDFSGGKRAHATESWPLPEFFDGKRKSTLTSF